MWRFLPSCGVLKNMEWDICIDNLWISDYGHICAEGMTAWYEKLSLKTSLLLKSEQRGIIFGGSSECSAFVTFGFEGEVTWIDVSRKLRDKEIETNQKGTINENCVEKLILSWKNDCNQINLLNFDLPIIWDY